MDYGFFYSQDGPLEGERFLKYCKAATSKINFNKFRYFFLLQGCLVIKQPHCKMWCSGASAASPHHNRITLATINKVIKSELLLGNAVGWSYSYMCAGLVQTAQDTHQIFIFLLCIAQSYSHTTTPSRRSPLLSILLFPRARCLTLMRKSDAVRLRFSAFIIVCFYASFALYERGLWFLY